MLLHRGVAQFGRASGPEPEGRWFESSRPDHLSIAAKRSFKHTWQWPYDGHTR
jgi:hypothetical protein